MAKRIAFAIGLATFVAMVTIVTGCEANAGLGAETNPVYAHCVD